jgi:diguanylate cyclase (GGDEF)-like protein
MTPSALALPAQRPNPQELGTGTMRTEHSRLAGSRASTLAQLALLSGLAVLLNALPVPMFYGIHVMLGSVPAIFALLLWQRWWGVAIGVLASLQTWSLWGHPWAVVIFSLEVGWLWLWLHRAPARSDARGNGQVMLLTIGYWLLIGAPLVFASYGLVMRIDPANVVMVAVKQSFNGVLNAELAFTALVITRALQSRHNVGPGVSLRGVIIALALLALTLPTLLISIAAGQQLQRAVEQGVLDGLKSISLVVSHGGEGQQTNQLLIEQLGGDLAFRRIASDGTEISSNPALFERLDGAFSDGGRSQVTNRDLALLVRSGNGPELHKWVNGYWSYSSQAKGPGGIDLVQVVEPARSAVTRIQKQSSQLLVVSLGVVVVGALLSSDVGRRFEREFDGALNPQQNDPGESDPPRHESGSPPLLRLSAVNELRTLAGQMNQRILEANQLSLELQNSNANLLRAKLELEGLLTTDPLTGCGNQKAFELRLQEEWHRARRSGEPLSCLCFALDGVALAYGEFGSQAGDELLRSASRALHGRLRITDHLFRSSNPSSNQEFVVIATGCSAVAAHRLGHDLLAAVDGIWVRPKGDHPGAGPSCDIEHREDPELRALPRVGIASLDSQQDSAESMVHRAQESLGSTNTFGARLTSSDHGAWAGEPS